MKELVELVGIVQRSKVGPGSGFDWLGTTNPKVQELYQGIASGAIQTEHDAVQNLYPSEPTGPVKVQQHKNRLKTKLLDILIGADLVDAAYNDRVNAYLYCTTRFAAATALLVKNAKLIGIEVCQKLLKQTLKFEFTELSLNILRILRLHFSSIEFDLKKYEEYQALLDELEAVWLVENKAEGRYAELVAFANRKTDISKEELHHKALAAYADIRADLARYTAFRLHLHGCLIEISIHTSVNDYHETVAVCEKYLAFFEAKNFGDNRGTQVCLYQLLICAIQLRDLDRGKDLMAKCQEVFVPGEHNWFNSQNLVFLLGMHVADYQLALNTFLETTSHEKLPTLPAAMQEQWKLNEAYLYLIYRLRRLELPPGAQRLANFKLPRFLNETPEFSRERRKRNIPVLVVQIMLLLVDRKHDKITAKVEALEKYRQRYLRTAENFRSNCFIHMVSRLPAAHFNAVYAQRSLEKYWLDLIETPLDVANQAHEVEIIPYERLWEMTLSLLVSPKGLGK